MDEQTYRAPFPAVILVVDDNPLNLQLISSLLRTNAYKPVVANSGSNALKYLDQKIPDLILLDIMMPEMDGFQVCEQLKANPKFKDIPVVFLTAKTEVTDVVKGFRLGAVDFITKPFRSEEVLVRIKTHLSLKQARKELETKNETLQQLNIQIENSHQKLEQQAIQLQELDAQKNRFFSILAHDLRNPFSGFVGMTRLLRDNRHTMDESEQDEFVQILDQTAIKVNKLLENLLKWSQVQMGSLIYEKSDFYIHEIVEECIDLKMEAAAQKSIQLINNTGSRHMVSADSQMTTTVLRNLISNALKFTKQGGIVKIDTVRLSNGLVQTAVRDNGIGMPEEMMKKLFQLSEKVSRPGTDGEESTGLGLLLCKALVEKQGGALWAASEEGEGSVFNFTLPDAYAKEK
ncbi:MAG: hybrid sensor histidine kinase/response regulator [Bacteroidetes bacterium]|nr:hybrid sensor histidine kinase/response regulator [Bacteroidota bacterium]MBU1579007.1 hybrid sensor histidine kinase/response regulator [Bacteroidota bacterium]MBU2465171.1 hybrid sensor histidine kinase/response regulator [Bacteroidota bacterium]MBU2556295.1 hybrid sensor histidine kinase/response regulator [Bacteroidota bacterium]